MESPPYTSVSPVSEWPSRLLHVPSMTSLERIAGNVYGGYVEPMYNILTYTWGRWENRSERAIAINGISWKVPAVDREHFSVDELLTVIKKICDNVELVWIDVACIDQDNAEAKFEEISKQAAIFQRANTVYVWLGRTSTEKLEICIYGIAESYRTMQEYIEGWNSCNRKSWIERCLYSLENLFADPWFTSLWTLQEAYLRKDAILMSRQAATIDSEISGRPRPYFLYRLVSECSGIYRDCIRLISTPGSSRQLFDLEKVQCVIDSIEVSGCYGLYSDNAIVLYSVARHRKTTRPLDRIFGIMQIYGFKIGSSDPNLALPQLEAEFGEELVRKSPILSQLFVHTEAAEPGLSWRISQSIEIPERARGCVSPKSLCHITFPSSGHARFVGKSCAFTDVLDFWKWASSKDIMPGDCSIQSIHLDNNAIIKANIPSDYMHTNVPVDSSQHQLADLLLRIFAGDLRVLLVGSMTSGIRGHREYMSVGLIAFEEVLDGTLRWLRTGICIWQLSIKGTFLKREINWQPFDGWLG